MSAPVALCLAASIGFSSPSEPVRGPGSALATLRSAILQQVNRERASRGAPALELDPSLNAAAQARAEEAARTEPFEGEARREDISRRVQEAGYDHRLVVEIVMRGGETAAERFDALREADPEAFADAMRREYRDLGVGVAKDGHGPAYVLIFGLSGVDDFAGKAARLSDLKRVRRELLERVNAERKARRLPPLSENALLDQAAQAHAEDMIRRSYYGHESPEGSGAFDRVRRAGYGALAVGENIAEGQSTAEEVMDAWMASPVHRDHILSQRLKEIGIGMGFGRNARGYEIVWVQDFAAPRPGEPVRPRRMGS